MDDYIRGQWKAYNRVLAYVNVIRHDLVDRIELYDAISAMCPELDNPTSNTHNEHEDDNENSI